MANIGRVVTLCRRPVALTRAVGARPYCNLSHRPVPLRQLARNFLSVVLPGASLQLSFRDALDHVRRVVSLVSLYCSVLNVGIETSGRIGARRRADITRQLASWVAILAVPTAIAGIYGMMFQHLPVFCMKYAYPPRRRKSSRSV